MRHAFFSPAWCKAVSDILREEDVTVGRGRLRAIVNVGAVDPPAGAHILETRLQIKRGRVTWLSGFDPNADATVTMPYEQALSSFLQLSIGQTHAAYAAGRITASGDMTVLMQLQNGFLAPHPIARERIAGLTDIEAKGD